MPGLLEETPRISHLQIHPKSGEVYLRLPAPNDNIIITPPRPSDAEAIAAIMNDERVALKFSVPPYPYHLEHAVAYLEAEAERHRSAVEKGGLFGECPVQVIREQRADGGDVLLGEARLYRSKYYEVRDEEESNRLAQVNLGRPAGDPEILWTIMGKRIICLSRIPEVKTTIARLPRAFAPWEGHHVRSSKSDHGLGHPEHGRRKHHGYRPPYQYWKHPGLREKRIYALRNHCGFQEAW